MHRYLRLGALIALALAIAACNQDSDLSSPTLDENVEGIDLALDDDSNLSLAKSDALLGVERGVRSYEIRLENLTPDTGDGGSQVFSPPVFSTHNRSWRMWRAGKKASEELADIAQDAVNQPMLDLLSDSRKVFQSGALDGPIPPGGSATFEVQTQSAMRRLSMAFMLVNTNDGFSGTDAIRLPQSGELVIYLRAYDAGSEANSEAASDIPGPCCGSPGMGTPTRERIHRHRGIRGVGDLDPDKYGWKEPVARLTIRRIAPTYAVTLENLTPDTGDGGSQVFSPPVLATHGPRIRIWQRNRFASEELAALAEDAINQPMLDLLSASDEVSDLLQGGGVIFPGSSDSYTIMADRGHHRLSMAFMLVNTNDGFSGTNSVRLPAGGTVSYYLRSYDAGSELNSELASDIPGPCCGSPLSGTASHDRIKSHLGIQGVGDLDVDKYGWDEPVAKLTLQRIK